MKYSFSFILSALLFGSIAQTERYGILTENGGSVFRMDQNGHPIDLLHRFDTVNGAEPMGSLVQRADEMYGRTKIGGINNSGVLYYVNTTSGNFSTIQHLPANYNEDYLSPYTAGIGDYYYNVGDLFNVRGRLYKTNFTLNTLDIVAEFTGYNTYYKPVATLSDLFVAASTTSNGFTNAVFRYDLSTQQLSDTLELDPAIFGSGTFQLVQLNDSVAYGINYAGGIHGEGTLSKLDLIHFTMDTVFSFDFPTVLYCPAITANSTLYLFNHSNLQGGYTCYSYDGIQLDSLFSFSGINQPVYRPGNIHVNGNRLVFSSNDITYNYDLVTQQLVTVAIIDNATFGVGSFMNEPTIFYDPLGLDPLNEQAINLFPNPVTDELTITTSGTAYTSITVYSAEGKQLDCNTDHALTLDVRNFQPGVYFLHIELNGQTIVRKFTKI